MSSSPTKESIIPKLAPPNSTPLHDPPSPRTHRALRRLQSAHTLGNSQPSLIQLQHRQHLQHNQTPVSTPHHSRGRSNSDASNMTPPPNLGAASRRPMPGRRPAAADALSLDRLIRDGPPDGDIITALESTRLKILDQGIKSDTDGMSSLRIYVWLILLDAPILETDSYLALIHRGASPAYSKIRNDTFRTLTTDPLYRRRVSEASLIRLLNAVAWKLHDAKEERAEELAKSDNKHTVNIQASPEVQSSTPTLKPRARALTLTTDGSDAGKSEPGTYVQGMNVLAAPFLYAARSEAEAFVAFYRFITNECPGYVRGAMDGVHKGLALVDKVLAIVDPKLSLYLMSKNMSAEVYAFPSVLTLCACTPPLPQVLRLWDFLFAYGAHLNILCIVAQLVFLRNSILSSPSPTKILRNFPTLQADTIKEVTLSLVKKIPDDVYAEIVSHAK
ncbi:Cell division control protein [Lachnellula hyalina]|uniref:Cell division control protein n=1 Tax=Lachnellula hyalina TaxID=1316788 RepID=A0A8H8RA95_9HELO|nr:Cell division control protein [Lachnellula hyalina]TVY30428.1 Cell division control protein [Lachnellula hyalina]